MSRLEELIAEGNPSGDACPNCLEIGKETEMLESTAGMSPDDYRSILICPVCLYIEEG